MVEKEITPDAESCEIRHQLDETRSSITEKLETLQDRMKDTVDHTRATVEETMHSVKQSVQDALHSIKRTFDLKYQAARHPWPMMGGALCVGLFLAHLTRGRRPKAKDRTQWSGGAEASMGHGSGGSWFPAQQARMATAEAQAPAKPSLKERLQCQFHDEFSKLQAVAIGAGAGIFRDWIKRAMPSLASRLEEVIDSATSKIGGEPIPGPVLRRGHNGHHDEEAE